MKPALAAAFIALSAVAAPAAAPVGDPIHHYVRSNRDGSAPEHIVHFRSSRTEVAVYKWVSKCTRAAYGTAEMSDSVREARRYVAGRVAPDGGQVAYGTLALDDGTGELALDVEIIGDRITERYKLPGRPYILYDFDLADLNAVLQENGGAETYEFELPMIWADEGASLFRTPGATHRPPLRPRTVSRARDAAL